MRGGVKLACRQGVSIGEDCHLVSMPKWGSEPWLIPLETILRCQAMSTSLLAMDQPGFLGIRIGIRMSYDTA